jgi:hypothetical protein
MQFHQVIGWRIEIDGVLRTFHDIREVAYAMARNIKAKNRHAKIEIVSEADGRRIEMLEDGRIA